MKTMNERITAGLLREAVRTYVELLDATPLVGAYNNTSVVLRGLYNRFGEEAAQTEINRQFDVLAWKRSDKLTCAEWDSFSPQRVYANGKCLGTLMPRMTQAQLAASPGIHASSTPEVETRRPGQ